MEVIISNERHEPPITLLLREVQLRNPFAVCVREIYESRLTQETLFLVKQQQGQYVSTPIQWYFENLPSTKIIFHKIIFRSEGSAVFGMTSKGGVDLCHRWIKRLRKAFLQKQLRRGHGFRNLWGHLEIACHTRIKSVSLLPSPKGTPTRCTFRIWNVWGTLPQCPGRPFVKSGRITSLM